LGISGTLEYGVGSRIEEANLEGAVITSYIDLSLEDESGREVYRRRVPTNSFLINFMKLLYALLVDRSLAGYNIDGASVAIQSSSGHVT